MSMNQSNNQIIKKNLLIICRGAGDLAHRHHPQIVPGRA